MTVRGLHHVTAIATDAARNLDFYTRILGLRLVKRTVTHEDPGAYHLIYGDEDGAPGSRLSFFAWPSAKATATQDVEALLLAVPAGALGWWERRLGQLGVACRRENRPFGREALTLRDPDSTYLALIEAEGPGGRGRPPADIPADMAIRNFLGVALSLKAADAMARLLINAFGYEKRRQEGEWGEFVAHAGAGGMFLLHQRDHQPRARIGAGSIHHVAFRTGNDDDLRDTGDRLMERFGIIASPVKDRYYFRSIYFRGPDGLLIETSTEGPGFLIDEPRAMLGRTLIFPPGLETRQEELLRILKPLE